VVERTADVCFMPLTVGGGVRTPEDMVRMLKAGADKVAINSAAVSEPDILRACARKVGSQAVVMALDVKREPGSQALWRVYTHGGRRATGLDAVSFAKRAAELGAGEILLTSMDRDGARTGYDIELLRAVRDVVRVPIIASGGAGSVEHMAQAVTRGGADAVLAASIFHFGEATLNDAKRAIAASGAPVRMTEPA
jgi:cyclase